MVSSTTTTDGNGAVGGKTARACDSCIKKRARWYCASDDAFLCQSCDSSVHSANPLARRHERVRLKTASLKSLVTKRNKHNNVPSWPQRKARTPRHGKQQSVRSSTSNLQVPEVGSDDQASNEEETEQQLLYRVPIYDPFVAELCNSSGNINSFDDDDDNKNNNCVVHSSGRVWGQEGLFPLYGKEGEGEEEEESLRDFLASEMELADFAADVESLLGRGVEEELGLRAGCSKEENNEALVGFREDDIGNGVVKEEEMMTLELGFDYDHDDEEELSPDLCCGGGYGDEAEWKMGSLDDRKMKGEVIVDKKRRDVLLRLDYEAVMSAWGSEGGGSPWTTGRRPDYHPDQSWADCLGTCGTELQHPYGEHKNVLGGGGGGGGGHPAISEDGGREARVSRYREKRRTRLFSKKIRYEVRKLNAEKRPRMKGRFVKRATFSGTSFPLLNK